MELKTILTYQELDIKLRKLFDILDKNEDSKRMEQAKQEFNAARQNIADCEREAEKLVEYISEAEKQYSESLLKLEELELVLENLEEEEQITQLISETERVRHRIIELERRLLDKKQRAEKVMRDYKEAGERGKKMREIHNTSKERIEALRKEKEPEINELKASLNELEKKVDSQLLEKYKTITNDGKYPAFVEAYEDGSTFSCRGCGLALSQKNKSGLVDSGMCICETCRRIIYRK